MATLISKTNGDFTAAGTWAVANPTAELDSDANTTNTTASFVASSSFAPGAIQVDAVAIKVSTRSTVDPLGTFTVDLYNATAASSVASVTVDVADLPIRGGWIVFPIPSTTLLVANNYQIRVLSSVAGKVTLRRDATAGNWSRQLRTTTTQAPAAGDKLIVAGEHTGPGAGNNVAVTMDSTAATSYGSTAYPQSVHISKRGTLQFGTSASTNYRLKVKGTMQVREGGTLTIGTTGSPVPSTSTALLEFDVVSAADSGLVVDGGTFRTGGASPAVPRAYLAADASAAATSLTSSVSTGWSSGDEIAVFPTTRVGSEVDVVTLSAPASGTTLPVSATTYAHSGTGIYAAEVPLLTRNVRVLGTSVSLTGYINVINESVIDFSWSEFKWLGHNSAAGKRGITLDHVSPGSASLVGCTMHSYIAGNSVGLYTTLSTVTNLTVTNCTIVKTGFVGLYLSQVASAPEPNINVNGLWTAGASSYGLYSSVSRIGIQNCRLSAVSYCLYLVDGNNKLGTVANNVGHAGAGMYFNNVSTGQINNTTFLRGNGYGLTVTSCEKLVFDTVVVEGCTSGGISVSQNNRCLFNSVALNGGAGFPSAYGVYMAGLNYRTAITSASIGTTTPHTTGDIVATGGATSSVDFMGVTFGSSTELSTNGTYEPGIQYTTQRYQGVAGSHKTVRWEGTLRRDTTIVNVAPSSVRLTPSSSLLKLTGAPISVSVQSGQTCSAQVAVRKSVAGDGTAYNGAQPRLLVLANPSAGIQTDAVIATASGPAGSWETLSGTTAAVSEDCVLEFVVDCDGTQGWVNYDTPSALSYSVLGESWAWGAPYMAGSSTDLATFTDVPTDKVELGYAYKYNSSITNRTGTRRQPGTSDVKTGVLYGPSDSLTGAYDGSDRWTDPGVANVRSGISYKANSLTNNRTGDVVEPSTGTVKIGTTYGTLSSLTGTYDGSDRWTDPGESVVLEGIAYKANSTTNNKLGTLDLSSVATATAAAVWNTNLTGFTTPATAGYILKMVLTQITNLISLSWIRRR